MSRVLRRRARRALFALALAGSTMSALAPAMAGDLPPPVYGAPPIYDAPPVVAPYPNGAAVYERGPGPCRIVFDRRVDPYGREIVHRLRVCDEGPVYPPVNEAVVPPVYGYPPYYAPAPSGYYGGLRPPAPIGQRYYY